MNYNELKQELENLADFNVKSQKQMANEIIYECNLVMRAPENTTMKTLNKRRGNAYGNLSYLYEMNDELQDKVIALFQEVTNKILTRKDKIIKIDLYIGDYFKSENKSLEDKFYSKYKRGQYIEPNKYLLFIQKLANKPSDVEYLNYLYQKHVLNSEIDSLNFLTFKILKSYATLPKVPKLPKKAFNNENIKRSCEVLREFINKN